MDDDDRAAGELAPGAYASDPNPPPPPEEAAAAAAELAADDAAASPSIPLDADGAAGGDDGDVTAAAYDSMQEVDAAAAGAAQVLAASEAVPEECAAATDEGGGDEKVDGDAIPAAADAVHEEAGEDDAHISQVSGIGGNAGVTIVDGVHEGDAKMDGAAIDSDNVQVLEVSEADEAVPATPNMVLEEDTQLLGGGSGDADDEIGANVDGAVISSSDAVVEENAEVLEESGVRDDAVDGEGVKVDEAGIGGEDAKLAEVSMAVDDTAEKELAEIHEDANPAGVTNAHVPKEGADEGVQMDETKGTEDDSVEEEDSDTPSDTEKDAREGEALPTDEEIGSGPRDNADEAADASNDVEEEGARVDEDVAAGDDGDDAADEEGPQMDAAATTGEDEEAEEVGMADNDVLEEEEGTQMDTVATTGDDDEEEEVGTGGDDAANEEGTQMDAVATTGDDDEEEEVGTAGDNVPEEDAAQMDGDDDDDEPPPLMTTRGGVRRKRGRPSSKAQAAAKPALKKEDEEVCFICFDGGELVVCDRRGCPKVYHPSCVNRDEAFFRAKGRWNCGWHICSNCQKPAHHMCYTCTYSLCKGCIKGIGFICVRGNKGFCETCMNTVMLIENKEEANEQMDGIDFDDKSSWWFLFKDYWLDLKGKLSLTLEEISAAKSQRKGSSLVIRDNGPNELPDTNGEEEASSDSSSGRRLESESSKKRGRKRSKNTASEDGSKGKESTRKSSKRGLSGCRDAQSSSQKKARKLSKRASSSEHQAKEAESVGTSTSSHEEVSWASKELLDFVAHMRNGDKSMLSQFDVQALLLEYIKRSNLRDPRRKSQIVCDSLLQNLFGKPRVGHFEMLKLLESHFLMNEVSPIDTDDNHGGVVDPDPGQDADGNSEASMIMSSEKRRKSRKKYEQRGPQTNLDDYAAIDNHNINLMYLRRNLMEELIDDVDTFSERVVGSFVRIRISGTGQRQDIYRLVQIVGTGRAAEKYKSGKKTTDITLEILNLHKREVITIDIISNQEFTEEECKRLRQSIKYGFIPRLTVGEIQEKARVLQAVKVNDWIESEKLRLGHLRDRASDMGRRKELRECVEKLQLLSTPEERARRLNEEPEIHADPTMDPDYESPEEKEQEIERKNNYNRPRDSFFRKESNAVSPGKGDNWNVSHRDPKANWEPSRNTWAESTSHMESSSNLAHKAKISSHSENAGYQTSKLESSNIGVNTANMEATMSNSQQGLSGVSSETLAASVVVAASAPAQSNVNESEKIWQYVDPSGKVQGPFSMVQLRKWNNNGYFPPSLRIWRASEKQDDSILLSDALVGKFEKDLPQWEPPVNSSSQIDKTYMRSNSDVGIGPRSSSLLEESVKIGQHSPRPVAPYRSQSFSGRGSQAQDYEKRNNGSVVIQPGAQGYYGTPNSQATFASQQSTVGSWNASSNQFGTPVNPPILSQPITGGFSVAQNIAVAGNIGQTMSVQVPMTANTADINLPPPSQNQTVPTLPLRDERSADGGQSKFEGDTSDGRVRSSAEDLGAVGAQPEATQLSVQQLGEGLKQILSDKSLNHPLARQESNLSSAEPTNADSVAAPADTRNQLLSSEASNSMAPSQWTAAPSTEPAQPSQTNLTGGDNQNSGWAMASQMANTAGQAQGIGNMDWGTAIQGNANIAWGMMGQANMNMAWGTPAQGASNFNMGLATPTQPNAVPNMGWVAPNQGNTNMNMAWAATQGQGTPNQAAMMGAQMQGLATTPWGAVAQGNANSYSGWGAPIVGSANQNVSWSTPVQGNTVPNPGNGAGQGNMNMNWNSPNANPNWNNQQTDNGGRHPGQSDELRGGESGGAVGRSSWDSRSGGDGGSWGPRGGVCRFYESGHCKKGYQCNYYHPPRNERHPSRNERQLERQPLRNERHFDRQNERHFDRQNDRQPSRNERQ